MLLFYTPKGPKVASLWNPWEGCAKRIMYHPAEVKPDENVCLGTYSAPIHWGFLKVFPFLSELSIQIAK